jgi:predicted amidohydrolase YtcJ
VLTEDIFAVPARDLDKARVFMTVFDGAVIYRQQGQRQ